MRQEARDPDRRFEASILTRLLRSALNGDSAVCIFLCIDPSESRQQTAIETLDFGSMIKHVRTQAKRRSQKLTRTASEARDLQFELLQSIQSRRGKSGDALHHHSLEKLGSLQEAGDQESDAESEDDAGA